MKTLKRTLTILLPCITAAGLFAEDYKIEVTLSNGGKPISYKHSNANKGFLGHQIAKKGEQIKWVCGSDPHCKAVSITFSDSSPCKQPVTDTCYVVDPSLLAFYKYNTVVTKDDGTTVEDDPEIVVDNAGIGTFGTKNKKKR
jgi:hypothetical protein